MAPARYAFAGLVLESALPLPELPLSERALPTSTISLAPPRPLADGADTAACRIRAGGRGNGYTVEFAAGASFDVSAGGEEIACAPVAGVSETTLRHLLLDQILPRVLGLRGALVLHASALGSPDGRAVAFLGASGIGKSTIAASLVGAGWSLLSDDALVIEPGAGGPAAVPTYPGLRLWPDVAAWLASGAAEGPMTDRSAKRRIRGAALGDGTAFSTDPVPLARIYLVEPEADVAAPAIRDVPPGEALRRAFEEEFRLAAPDRPSLQASFDRIASSGILPLFRSLSYARRQDVLPALHEEIRRDMREP